MQDTTNKKRDAKSIEEKLGLRGKIIVSVILALILIVIAVFIHSVANYFKGQRVYDDIASEYTSEDLAGSGSWYDMVDVDMAALKLVNRDTRGWLYIEDSDITYPIVQASDDEKYLSTSFFGDKLRAGSIFLEALNKGDFSDENSIIYGHNMRDKSMFGALNNYKDDPEYYKTHLFYQVITPDRIYRYQIFAFGDVSETSDIYTITFTSDEEYIAYIRDVKKNSSVDIDVPDVSDEGASDDDKIMQNYKKLTTLSTCTSRDDMRFVVVGTLVGEYDRVNDKLYYDSIEF